MKINFFFITFPFPFGTFLLFAIAGIFCILILCSLICLLIYKFINISSIINKSISFNSNYQFQIFEANYLKFISAFTSPIVILLIKCFYSLQFVHFALFSLSLLIIVYIFTTEYFIKLAFNSYNFIINIDNVLNDYVKKVNNLNSVKVNNFSFNIFSGKSNSYSRAYSTSTIKNNNSNEQKSTAKNYSKKFSKITYDFANELLTSKSLTKFINIFWKDIFENVSESEFISLLIVVEYGDHSMKTLSKAYKLNKLDLSKFIKSITNYLSFKDNEYFTTPTEPAEPPNIL